MKQKLLASIITLLSCTTSAIAQDNIDREVEGIVLGKHVKVQAARILQSRGFHVGSKVWDFKSKPEEQPTLLQDTVVFLGETWDGELFNATADKVVYRFCYTKENKTEMEIDDSFKAVLVQLNEKYKVHNIEQTDYYATYSDQRTEISLWKTTDTSLRLCYQVLKFDEIE